MNQLSLFRELLSSDKKSATQLIVSQLRTPTQFAEFLDIKNQQDKHAAIGEAITLLLQLANEQHEQFMQVFLLFQQQYAKFLLCEEEEEIYHICLALYVFFSQFLRIDYSNVLEEAERQFGGKYPRAFAEFVLFDHLSNYQFKTAWQYESKARIIDLLLQRGSNEIEMVAALICLHQKMDDNVNQQLEEYRLKYGAKKLNAEIERMRVYFLTPPGKSQQTQK